jgi:hypothetical protein
MSSTTTITCANHPEVPVASFCRTCGKPLCAACRRTVGDTVFCEEHAPEVASSRRPASPPQYASPVTDSPYTAPPNPVPNPMAGNSPAIAFGLGFIPGVGAIYNGQYAKGLVHAVVFGLLVTAVSSNSLTGFKPLIGILIGVFVFYMAIEAFHTARKRASGELVEEFSSLVGVSENGFPTGAVVLISLGFLLLLNTLDLISIEAVVRFWPVGLILIGAYMLYSRLKGGTR